MSEKKNHFKFPIARPLIVLVKALLQQKGLNSPFHGGLGSYAVTLLILTFLRIAQFDSNNKIEDLEAEKIGQLLIQMFIYFSRNLFTHGYCASEDAVPVAPLRIVGKLEIWDPLNENNNVAFSCSKVYELQNCFSQVANLLLFYHPSMCKSILAIFIDALLLKNSRTPIDIKAASETKDELPVLEPDASSSTANDDSTSSSDSWSVASSNSSSSDIVTTERSVTSSSKWHRKDTAQQFKRLENNKVFKV